MATQTTGPTKQEIESVFTRLRAQPANKVSVLLLVFALGTSNEPNLFTSPHRHSPASTARPKHPPGPLSPMASLFASIARLCTAIWVFTWPSCAAPTWILTGRGCSCARCSWVATPTRLSSSGHTTAPTPTLKSSITREQLNSIGTN